MTPDNPGAVCFWFCDRETVAATIAAVRPVITALSPIWALAVHGTARSRAGLGAPATLAARYGRPGISTDTPGLTARYLPEVPVPAKR